MAKSRGRKFAEITSPTSGVFDLTSVPTITNAKLQNSAMTLAGSSVSLGGTGVADTDALSEGSSNLYFTNARVQSFLGGGTLAGNIVVPDNISIYLGSSSDFRLVHNTTNTQLINATGALQVTSNGGFDVTGAATFSAGAAVTGVISSTSEIRTIGSSGSASNRLKLTYDSTNGTALIGPDSNGGSTTLALGTSNSGTYANALTIANTGIVGIGMTPVQSVGAPLQLQSSTGYVGLRLNGTGNYAHVWDLYASKNSNNDKMFGVYDRNADEYRLAVFDDGYIGIGTTNPQSYYSKNLVVLTDGDNTGGITLVSPATDDTAYLCFADGTSGAARYAGYLGYSHNDEKAFIGIGGTTRMTILSSGRTAVGGNHTPGAPLDVRGTNDTTFASSAAGNPANVFLTGTNAYDSGYAGSGILFGGHYTSGGAHTTFGIVSGIKENTTDAEYGGALTFMTRTHGQGAGNRERMRISSTGNVGIGTSSPSALLNVNTGASGSHDAIVISRTTHGTVGTLKNAAGSLEVISNKQLTLASDPGNSFTAAGSLIDFQIDGGSKMSLNSSSQLYIPSGRVQANTALMGTVSGHAMFGSNSVSEPIVISRDFSISYPDIAISTYGNVGIGTTSPTHYNNYKTLTIGQAGVGSIIELLGYTTNHKHLIQNNNGQMILSADHNAVVGNTSIYLQTDGNNRMRISTNNYPAFVAVHGGNGALIVNDTGAEVNFYATGLHPGIGLYTDGAYSSCGAHMEIASNATVGWSPIYINKYNATSSTDNRWISFGVNGYNTDSATIAYSFSTGNFTLENASDYRIKENVENYSGGLEKIEALRVVSYNKIHNTVGDKIEGFIAHELQEVIPAAVSGEKDAMKVNEEGKTVPDYQMLSKETLVPYLVSAIQELSAEVKALKAKLGE